ncbi:MAG TPA: phosphoribosylglycinamide formyltransferase [Steroidobacter sp.]|uniref:phosphoribosylglycinamide formyltransferase n=1 Tax=Steroidobacter sp. TaxID=1978227 RepID=UPI002ED78AD5
MTSAASGSPQQKLPIVILISGRGTNMHAIAQQAASGAVPVEIRAVISDKAEAAGLATAAAMNIPTRSLSARDFPDRASYDQALAALVASFEPQLVVLAGFMRILSPGFIAAFADRILNIHPSLLPLYRGLHTHRRALEAGDALHGCSVHFVTEELDGGPLVIQAQVKVRPDDSESTLSARVQQQEYRIYSQAIDWFARGRLQLREQRAWLDGRPLDTPVVISADD